MNTPDFDSMNETDVREIIVRPLLDRLGYKHGTQANIRTEVPLRYSHAFLGRKKSTDPPLAGRADYICDAVSYGRWVVEVKSPQAPICRDDIEQAHTYSAHPDIAALYFMLTNGREFYLYATGRLDAPLLKWRLEETEQFILQLYNTVSYQQIKKLCEILQPDPNKPLGKGLRSKMTIVGGETRYGKHTSTHPLFQIDALNGLVGAITGEEVKREDDGRLHAIVSVRSPNQTLAQLNKLAGIEDFHFFSSEEFISDNVAHPTIFQNIANGSLAAGTPAQLLPGADKFPMPFGFQFNVFTEAAGFVEGDEFKGVLFFDYDYLLVRGKQRIPTVDELITYQPRAKVEGEGEFRILLR